MVTPQDREPQQLRRVTWYREVLSHHSGLSSQKRPGGQQPETCTLYIGRTGNMDREPWTHDRQYWSTIWSQVQPHTWRPINGSSSPTATDANSEPSGFRSRREQRCQ